MAARARFIALYEENYDAVHAFCARRVGFGDALLQMLAPGVLPTTIRDSEPEFL